LIQKSTNLNKNNMKKIKGLFVIALTTISFAAISQTVDEVVDKHLAAVGGKDKWKAINSVIMEGSMEVQGASVNITSKILQGKGSRQDINVMGMSGYTIITPTAGWTYMPWAGQSNAEAMADSLVKMAGDQLDAQGSLVDYKTKGNQVELLGKEDVDGKPAFKLKVTRPTGKVETIFIDANSYYNVKTVAKQNVNGQEVEGTVYYSDFQKQGDGYVFPMKINMPMGMGMNADFVLSKVSVNQPVDESVFKP